MCANSEPHAAAPPSAPSGANRWRVRFAKWARNLTIVGYMFALLGSCARLCVGLSGAHRYSPADDRGSEIGAVAWVAVLLGIFAFLCGACCFAITARRPWQFGLRQPLAATAAAAVAAGVLHSSRVLADLLTVRLADTDGPCVHLVSDDELSTDGMRSSVVLHFIPLDGLALLFVVVAFLAGVPIPLFALFKRVYKRLHFTQNR